MGQHGREEIFPLYQATKKVNSHAVNEFQSVHLSSSLSTNLASSLCILGKGQEERSKTQFCPEFYDTNATNILFKVM